MDTCPIWAPCSPPPAFCLFSKQGLALEPRLALELTILLLQLLDSGTAGKYHHALLRHSIGSRAGSGSLLINYDLPMKKVIEGSLLMWMLTDGSADCSTHPSHHPGADGKYCHKRVHTACIAEGPGCFERPSAEICWLQYRLSFGGFSMSLCIPR